MLRIAICDDDLKFAENLENLILADSYKLGIIVETDIYTDGKFLLNSIQADDSFDLIFLDIEMKHIDGISAAKKIRETNRLVLFIFISNYDNYFPDLFEVEAFRFLSKPLNKSKFSRYLLEAYKRTEETATYFQFTFKREIQRIPLKDIVYFESHKRTIHIFRQDGSSTFFYGKLNAVEKELSESKFLFFRTHQSFLVNYTYITKMNFFYVTINLNGKEIELKISQDRRKNVRNRLCEMAARKMGGGIGNKTSTPFFWLPN
ncbi:LytR/AlgR family response regulator transcription factor [Butyrivibrio sp. AE2005]|uniref:LytR/AlgR family response regulator transcription factor n=1 Tax=Butyrivibrio sp. AE2005 TaxID=1496722 RepID=UPI00069230D8|nr:LytTR family DNA-binding domain-containing protein [Butyrivibrio sp. AE2005]